ncbi:MAG: D-aminoacyl-tRNA deacylase [Bacteroidales bacterium]|nr:D-aminoacyl-tRNA deacylase [Bacteroidales bacterium]
MRVVIQRVKGCFVSIKGEIKSNIGTGLLVLASFENADTEEDLTWMSGKIADLRIFDDEKSIMNLSLKAVKGEMMIVSQFTLHAKTKKGNRPSYIKAAKPEIAKPMYEKFIKISEKELGKEVKTGEFGADMQISLINDGPVTIIIDSKYKDL